MTIDHMHHCGECDYQFIKLVLLEKDKETVFKPNNAVINLNFSSAPILLVYRKIMYYKHLLFLEYINGTTYR